MTQPKQTIMKRSISILALTLLSFVWSFAGTIHHGQPTPVHNLQNNFRARVYFSNEVPVSGVAKEGKEFTIDANGSFLYVVVDNYPTNFTSSQLRVKVYKTNSSLQLVSFDDKNYDINTGYYYTYIKYSFYSAGTYTFDVYTGGGDFIGSGSVVINMNSSSSSSSTSSSSDPYSKSRVYFSTEVPSYGIAKDVKNFTIPRGGGYVYAIVDNYPTNFNITSLKLYVYKSIGGSYELQDEKTYTINGNYYFTYFKWTFDDAGDYKFVVYDGNDKYVNTGYVSIGWQ